MIYDKVLKCPNCASNRPSVFQTFAEPGHNSIFKCDSCNAIYFQDNQDYFFSFSKAELPSSKSLLISQEQDFYINEHFKRIAFNFAYFALRQAVRHCAPGILVDIGCGNGGYGEVLSGFYEKYYGFDPSEIPENIRITSAPDENITLVHYDPVKPLCVHDSLC